MYAAFVYSPLWWWLSLVCLTHCDASISAALLTCTASTEVVSFHLLYISFSFFKVYNKASICCFPLISLDVDPSLISSLQLCDYEWFIMMFSAWNCMRPHSYSYWVNWNQFFCLWVCQHRQINGLINKSKGCTDWVIMSFTSLINTDYWYNIWF